jgi:hypothetical protein
MFAEMPLDNLDGSKLAASAATLAFSGHLTCCGGPERRKVS